MTDSQQTIFSLVVIGGIICSVQAYRIYTKKDEPLGAFLVMLIGFMTTGVSGYFFLFFALQNQNPVGRKDTPWRK